MKNPEVSKLNQDNNGISGDRLIRETQQYVHKGSLICPFIYLLVFAGTGV